MTFATIVLGVHVFALAFWATATALHPDQPACWAVGFSQLVMATMSWFSWRQRRRGVR